MKKKIVNGAFVAVFALIVLFFTGKNIPLYWECLQNEWNNNQENFNIRSLEDYYRDHFSYRKELISGYGVVQLALNRGMIGAFEFYKDEDEMMHSPIAVPDDTSQFVENVVKFKDALEEKGTDFVYVQIPAREMEGYSSYPSSVFDKSARCIETTLKDLKDRGISCLDIGELCLKDEAAPPYQDFYLKSDLHLTTDAELWVEECIVDYLEEHTECKFDRSYLDKNNYSKETYPFVGGFARASGEYYSDTDMFDLYFPKFETSMSVENSAHELIREGAFEDTVMNQYTKNVYDKYTYWVTDYMMYTAPIYKIKNHLQDHNKIMVVIDSMCFRTMAYLSLACEEVTVVDIRFFNGVDYITPELESNQYDAVIMCHQTSLFDYPIQP